MVSSGSQADRLEGRQKAPKSFRPRLMHIVLTADPELPVPPKLYGGIERVIAMFAAELTNRGHRVTLVAHPESTAPGTLVPWPGGSSSSLADTANNASTLWSVLRRGQVDVLHSFSRIAYLLPLLPLPVPKLMSYQRPITRRTVQMGQALSLGSLQFSAISKWMMEPVADIGRWHLVPNGVPLSSFPFVAQPGPDAPLMFLGRVEAIKGPHLAIEVAQRTNLPLVIAGNVPSEHQSWFDAQIAPHLNEQIRYVGPVDDARKAELLGRARALLMPILWDEPFGIVMAEAMACGTPVLGLRRGSVPEVVEHGLSGLVVDNFEQMVAAIPRLNTLDRRACRARVESCYSETAVVEGYLSVYRQLLARRTTGAR
jgi:glycosyltransferase involved in cell wall biosynthesis